MLNKRSSMDLTLVPFGYSESEGRLVDVQQVQSGKQCGCVCPSCKAPLVARKGNKKIWHFAHDSGSEIVQKLEKCTYSFFVSARMMARQLIGDSLEVALPDYEIVLSEKGPQSVYPVHVSERVTGARRVQLSDVVMDVDVNGQRFDILGYVGGHALAFIFTHPGRDGIGRSGHHEGSESGIVAIALDGLKDVFRRQQSPDHSYGDILANYISNDTRSKKWISHPRRQQAEEKAREKLNKALRESRRAASHERKIPTGRSAFDENILAELERIEKADISAKKFKYVCRLCNSSWVGTGKAKAVCRKCNNELLVSKVGLDG